MNIIPATSLPCNTCGHDIVLCCYEREEMRLRWKEALREVARLRHALAMEEGIYDEEAGLCAQCGAKFYVNEGQSGRTYLPGKWFHSECLASAVEDYYKSESNRVERDARTEGA